MLGTGACVTAPGHGPRSPARPRRTPVGRPLAHTSVTVWHCGTSSDGPQGFRPPTTLATQLAGELPSLGKSVLLPDNPKRVAMEASLHVVVHQCLYRLVLGSVYAIIALGYTMVYGILRIINFAHGEILMIGAMVTLSVAGTVQRHFAGLGGLATLAN